MRCADIYFTERRMNDPRFIGGGVGRPGYLLERVRPVGEYQVAERSDVNAEAVINHARC